MTDSVVQLPSVAKLVLPESIKKTMDAPRQEDELPHLYRLAITHDKQLVLQGAYLWLEGDDMGVTWRDMPLVRLNENGEATAYAQVPEE